MRLNCLRCRSRKFLRVLAALLADRQRVHVELLAAQQIVHLDLDGQPVTVPARHIGGVVATHAAALDDEILQRLVQRRAQMQGAIGIGRAVMHYVDGLSLVRLANAVVNPLVLPASEHLRLVLRQIRLHGEVGLGQVQRGFQVERHSLGLPHLVHGVEKRYAGYLFIIGSRENRVYQHISSSLRMTGHRGSKLRAVGRE